MGTLGCRAQRLFCVLVGQFVCLPQYSYGMQELTAQKASQNSMRCWCFRQPRIMCLRMRHVVRTETLNVGVALYEGRLARGEAVVKWRKRDACH